LENKEPMSGNKEQKRELELAPIDVAQKPRFKDITGQSVVIQSAIDIARRYALHDSPVLIVGETGTGKEIFARSIHEESARSNKPFIAVNCSAIPAELFENEFFGHTRGAYTGAGTEKPGLFEQADGGTLFLDEINSLALSAQPKLLRALQERECRRLGDTITRRFDVRIISASNCDLKDDARSGRFRRDLFYRIAVLTQVLPPLREHREDIPILAVRRLHHLIRKWYGSVHSKIENHDPVAFPTSFTPAAIKKMTDYSWPGNVRELESAVEEAWVLAKGPAIDADDLPFETESPAPAGESLLQQAKAVAYQFIHEAMIELLEKCKGNITRAAKLAGMNRRSFFSLMCKHQLRGSAFGNRMSAPAFDELYPTPERPAGHSANIMLSQPDKVLKVNGHDVGGEGTKD
jgi:transcriptional regulator with PAS, ATPase and Fis domain